jgi:hypothetical protein
MPNTTATAPSVAVHRVEIRSRPGMPDPKGDAAVRSAATLGLPEPPRQVHHAAVYLIEGAPTSNSKPSPRPGPSTACTRRSRATIRYIESGEEAMVGDGPIDCIR